MANCHADTMDNILIPPYSDWKYDTGAPAVKSTAWTRVDFDDSRWRTGRAGFGYGDDDDRTELEDMRDNYRGIKIRHEFEIDDPDHVEKLHLYVRFDDGFVAYINGREVTRVKVSAEGNQWVAEGHEADGFDHFVIDNAAEKLIAGGNVIAIAGVNNSTDSSDFSLDPVLATAELDNPGVPPVLSREQYLADLDAFETRLEDQSSYLTLTDLDYRREISILRENAKKTIRTEEFARQLKRVIAKLGDAHAEVLTEFHDADSRYLPFVVADTDTGLVAIEDESNSLLDAAHPYVVELDNIALGDWLAAADQYVDQASKQLQRRRGLKELRWISVLRTDLGLTESDDINVTLQSADGKNRVTHQYALSPERRRSGKVPLTESRLLDSNIGYLRIGSMSNSRLENVLNELQVLLDTDGLVIDVRDNTGGQYDILHAIYGYFLPESAEPYVSNIAAYRRSLRFDDDHLYYRPTYPLDHPQWSSDQRKAIRSALKGFDPQWEFPEEQFSEWHFMLLGKQPQNEETYYSKPVVVLSNAGSFSATDGFLSAFADLEQVTIMGLPSAGGSGATERFELPHSGIRLALSSMASYRPDGSLYDGNGVEVDVRVVPTITDYLGETDSVLDQAISLILANR